MQAKRDKAPGWWARRQVRKQCREILRQAHHVRNMREDLLPDAALLELAQAEQAVERALKARDAAGSERAGEALHAWVLRHAPRRRFPGIRENLEILVVAVAVAMACRTYFIQPFKIPTGSMQPTLFGIQYRHIDAPRLTDRFPLKLLRWLTVGEWYVERKALASGYVARDPQYFPGIGDEVSFYIGNVRHVVPEDGFSGLSINDYVEKGDVLWRGVRVAGDHVFVDKVRWNLTKPKRGQIIVFNTDNIETLPPKTHYIKRLVGLPGETVRIDPPDLIVDGEPVRKPEGIARIARMDEGYEGYQLITRRTDSNPEDWALRTSGDRIDLNAGQYFALGDNTGNSRDGRYWGAVPQPNLVGPAVAVYWPLSERWGVPK